MAPLPIRKYPDKILREKAAEVITIDQQIDTLIDEMIETMFKNDGVGLAAPQVGVLKRIIIAAPKADNTELYVFINPVITRASGEVSGSEGCLSVPGSSGEVIRAKKICFSALDRKGNPVSLIAEDFFARILQHETDHLLGKLYIDHLGFAARKQALHCLQGKDVEQL
jgi:peptide deformylase